MKLKLKAICLLATVISGCFNLANAEESKKTSEEIFAEANWECGIDNDTFELILVDMEKGTFNHTIKDNGYEVCTSDNYMSECNHQYIETVYYYYKRGKMVDNSGGNRLYRLCRADALTVDLSLDDKKEEQAEYEAKGGTKW